MIRKAATGTGKKRIIVCLTLMVFIITFAGCVPNEATEDFRDSTTQECIPEAEAWFRDNYHDVAVKASELFSDGYDCTRNVTGSYEVNGEEFGFMYNCDTGEMLSDAAMNHACKQAEELVAGELGFAEYEKCEVNSLGFVYDVTFVNNRKNGWDEDSKAETEADYSTVGMSLHYLPIFADDAEIEKMVIDRLETKHPIENMWLDFYFSDEAGEIPEDKINSLFSKYPGIGSVRIICESKDICIDYEN